MEQQDLSYKAKQIRFGGRICSVLCQDVNGPCPILALANVLLLRGQLQLPPDVGEVSEVSGAPIGSQGVPQGQGARQGA